jgi:hypothetical protein
LCGGNVVGRAERSPPCFGASRPPHWGRAAPTCTEEREIDGLLVGMPGDLFEVKRQAQAGTLGDRAMKRRVPANCRNRCF